MKIVVINVGANTKNPGFRGPIFSDGSFRFVPFIEGHATERPVTYTDMGLAAFASSKGLNPATIAHYDPEFETFTYGHIRRGFGDDILWNLLEGDCLMFMSTLDYYGNDERAHKWGAYVIGYFIIERRPLTQEGFSSSTWANDRFLKNAHFRRIDKRSDLWIAGSLESKLLKKAFPLSSSIDSLKPNELTKKVFLSRYSKVSGWYRWTLSCSREEVVSNFLSTVKSHSDC